ncbi:MAG: hypothetical protein BIFFINMI_00565 [Phycisphaerae bacterium]|nr:hypothetical protein [Phycisphaerae bacterium]
MSDQKHADAIAARPAVLALRRRLFTVWLAWLALSLGAGGYLWIMFETLPVYLLFMALFATRAWRAKGADRRSRFRRLAFCLLLAAAMTSFNYVTRVATRHLDVAPATLGTIQWSAMLAQWLVLSGILLAVTSLDAMAARLMRRWMHVTPRRPEATAGDSADRGTPWYHWRRAPVGLVRTLLFVFIAMPWFVIYIQVYPPRIGYTAEPTFAPYESFEAGGSPGWLIPAARPSDTVVLICHGLAGDQATVLDYAQMFHDMGCHVVTFDMPGHGRGPGFRVTYGWDESDLVETFASRIRRRADKLPGRPRRLIAFGGSMGGTSLLLAAERRPELFDGLILDSAYPSLGAMANSQLSVMPEAIACPLRQAGRLFALWESRVRISMVDVRPRMQAIDNIPKLFIHCRQDPLVAPRLADELFTDAGGDKRFVQCDCTEHQGAVYMDYSRYRDTIRAFIFRVAPATTQPTDTMPDGADQFDASMEGD